MQQQRNSDRRRIHMQPQDEEGTLIQFIEEIDAEYQDTYTEEELNALTIDQIKTIATAKGYTITKTVKAEIIAEFLAAQTAAGGTDDGNETA